MESSGIMKDLKGGLNVSDHMEVDVVSLIYISEPNSFRRYLVNWL